MIGLLNMIFGSWISTVILDIVYVLLCNFIICMALIRINCMDVRLSRCLVFTVIMTAIVSLPSYAIILSSMSSRFSASFYAVPLSIRALLRSIFSFRNPLWLAAYFVAAQKILGMTKRNVASSCLMVFLFSELFALMSDGAEFLYLPFQDYLSPNLGFCLTEIILITCITVGNAYLHAYIDRNIHRIKMMFETDDENSKHRGLKGFLSACALWSLLASGQMLTTSDLKVAGYFFFVMIAFIITLIIMMILIKMKNVMIHQKNFEYDMLFETIEDLRGIRHDMNNVLQVYQGYIILKDYDGLVSFHKELFDKTIELNENLNLQLQLNDSPALYGLFLSMGDLAQALNVTFEVENTELFKQIDIPEFNLCRLLSNLIKNAIESAALATNPFVKASIRCSSHYALVLITNTTKERVDISRIFKTGFTTMHGHSGRGLCEVNKILARYFGCTIIPTYDEPYMYMSIKLPKKVASDKRK